MTPSMPGPAPSLNLLQGAGKPMPLAVAAAPAAGAVPGMPVAAFATDLAKLLSGAVPAEAASLIASPEPDLGAEPGEGVLTDAVAALWIELGIAAPAIADPLPLPTRLPQGVAMTSAATSAISRAATGALPNAYGAGLPAAMPGVEPGLKLAAALTPEAALFASLEGQPGAKDLATAAAPTIAVPVFTVPDVARPTSPALPPAVVDLRHPQAPQQIAETVVWNVGKGMSEVQIRLNPEDLGPIEVQLKLDGDKVAVRFDMADASVRDVVQTSLPNLASLLAARGLQLDQAQVFQQDRGHAQAQPEVARESRGAGEDSESDPVSTPRVTLRRGLVDDYV